MYLASHSSAGATTLVVESNDMETPKNAIPFSRLAPNQRSAFHRCGAASVVDTPEETNHLVKSAPKLPDALEEEEEDSQGHCIPLTRLPPSRLRMRPSKEVTTVIKTPLVSFSYSMDSTDDEQEQALGDADRTVLPPLTARLPPYVMLPGIPSEFAEGCSTKFVLKPKPLSSSFQPIGLAGASN